VVSRQLDLLGSASGGPAGCAAKSDWGRCWALEGDFDHSRGISGVWVPFAVAGSTSPQSIQDDRPDGPIERLLLFSG
jgi:hypothetical protein